MKRLRMAMVVSIIVAAFVLLGALSLATYRRHVVFGMEVEEHEEMMGEMHEHEHEHDGER